MYIWIMDRRRSEIWVHFSQLNTEQKAKCLYCKSLLSFKGGTTSNLKKHLEVKHPSVYISENNNKKIKNNNALTESTHNDGNNENNEIVIAQSDKNIKACVQTKIDIYRKGSMSIVRKKVLDHYVLKMIIKDLQPFSVVENEGFIELVRELNASYKLPNRFHLSKDLLPQVYMNAADKLKAKLSDAQYITLTTDTWTSNSLDNYMAITAHFISDNWTMQSYLIDCFNMPERHTAENLKNQLINVTNSWGIYDKVHTIVTDNASNITAAIKLTTWYHWPCLAHTLNLAVQNSLEIIEELLKKVKHIVDYFHKSTVAASKLKEMQVQMMNINTPLKLINDIRTRWNSTYAMLQRILIIQEPLEAAIGILHNPVAPISVNEWEVIKELCEILKPFEKITADLSAEKYVSISKVILMIGGLKRFLSELKYTIKQDLSKQFLDKLFLCMNERFRQLEYNPILTRPTFLDPRFKAKAFEDSTALSKVKNNITDNLTKVLQQQQEGNVPTACSQSEEKDDGKNDIIWGSFIKKIQNSTNKITATTSAILEIRQYLEEPYINLNDDPLNWWKERTSVFPGLSAQAKRHLSVVATSVPSERVFSLAGQIITERRSRLKPESAKMLIFLNSNQDFLN